MKNKRQPITLLYFCHVVRTNMNSRYHSNKILRFYLKATRLFKLRYLFRATLGFACINYRETITSWKFVLISTAMFRSKWRNTSWYTARSKRWSWRGRSGARHMNERFKIYFTMKLFEFVASLVVLYKKVVSCKKKSTSGKLALL